MPGFPPADESLIHHLSVRDGLSFNHCQGVQSVYQRKLWFNAKEHRLSNNSQNRVLTLDYN